MKPKILCLSFSDIRADSRVLRQLAVLAEFGEVTTLSYGDKPAGSSEHLTIDSALPSLPQTIPGVLALALRRYSSVILKAPAVREAAKLAAGRQFDLIVANEARALPLAHFLSEQIPGGAPVWGDMHEWAPEERVHVRSWRLLIKPFMSYVCLTYLPRTHAITAVNESIAELYRKQFGCSVEVVRNAGPYQALKPSALRAGVIRLAHSGAAVPGRNLEGMIQAVLELGSPYTLDLYLVRARDGGKYWQQLKDLTHNSDQIVFHDAVPPVELSATLNQYDLGIFSLPPLTTNHKLMLPNKFFDFVQARLGLVFSPSPETSRLIQQYDLGVITEDFSPSSLARAIKSLSVERIQELKNNAHLAAQALSSAEDEAVERTVISRLLPSPAE
jgi:hypothetical protein